MYEDWLQEQTNTFLDQYPYNVDEFEICEDGGVHIRNSFNIIYPEILLSFDVWKELQS